ncbi:MAG: polysaccharide deacetylase family protein [Proteobacteria bacterium]|nr:polysaccharide deacetylase family protein [Pseudomonadota bacterium]
MHLTFDDGPDPIATPKVLDLLARHSLKATFFLIGAHVEQYPEIAKRAAEEGHVLGVHSFEHTRLAFRARALIEDQIGRTRKIVQSATGQDTHLFRPPFGFIEPSLLKHVGQMGFSTVMWDVDPGDSLEKNPDLVVKRVSSVARAGLIILLHDNENTRDRIESTLLGILESLKARSLPVIPLGI